MSKVTMPPHGNTEYPWDRWENGKVHRAVRGSRAGQGDFSVTPEHFRRAVTTRARRIGRKAVTRVQGDTVIFQFVEKAKD